jgi:glycosyltransferase involved in cell wall biosynthesis
MRKRILFVTYAKHSGGAEKHLVELILRLDFSRIDPIILCLGSDFFAQALNVKHGLNITIYSSQDSKTFLTYWLTFIKFRPQVIVFVNAFSGFFAWYAYLAARLSGAGRVLSIEHTIAEPAPLQVQGNGFLNGVRRAVGWRARHMLGRRLTGMLSSKTICVSEAVRRRLIDDYGYEEGKTVRVWNGVDLDRHRLGSNQQAVTRGDLGIGSEDIVIICVANLLHSKRIDILLKAMAAIAEEGYPCRCIILGQGPLKDELERISRELGLSSVVSFLGYKDDVRPYLNIGDMFVLCSRQEGLPLTLGEAMACGLPCVVTDVGGNSEIVLHGHTGMIIAPGSDEELAKAIKYLFEHADERLRMGKNARKRVEEFFDIEDRMAELKVVLLG